MPAKKGRIENELSERRKKRLEEQSIMKRVLKEWPTMQHLNQAMHILEVFAQLMKLPQFVRWMKANIEVRDEINHEKKVIDTYVIYKGPEGEPGPDQHLVKCPGCGVTFDAACPTPPEPPMLEVATTVPSALTKDMDKKLGG